ncbi:DUF6519 domain-containing protein [Amycolatopsis mongoliensis]|uniref:DUF6519 domain-containing protein n=1 Tax=Amycolatopsis mongoliensis TaxID=715475 RepID=A0A9Y2JKL2_9PSEU|nr:DUF6519 domain-containing protein [Amycolatopsis sp. 4-36]WIX99180.1 DUF6519 domain-containing protein [Amycolatopsis sp. 4-36]
MKADFSRSTFRPGRGYSAVLAQQGRVQLDADVNEQAAIQLHLARTIAADVIGPHGGPGDGFTVAYVPSPDGKKPADLAITPGRYYVDGVLADSAPPPVYQAVGGSTEDTQDTEDTAGLGYWNQPFAFRDPENGADLLPTPPFLVYLRLDERLVTAVQDPAIRESALGAALPDTGARTQVTWQVLAAASLKPEAFDEWVTQRTAESAFLAARVQKPDGTDDDPCVLAPDAAYRGPENQLYRVEVHQGGSAESATFKWSRDNGSIVFPLTGVDGQWVTLETLGRDDKLAVEVGDWVEAADDTTAARDEVTPLLRVEELDPAGRRVRLSAPPEVGSRHPLLRRWDQQPPRLRDGAVRITEGDWLDLEDGVQVWFAAEGTYRTGDHWLIPARTLTADVEWPVDTAGRPLLLPPAGEPAHYAPLAWVGDSGQVTPLRRTFQHLPPL